MCPIPQSQGLATIRTGGAAKWVMVPPTEILTNNKPMVAYLKFSPGSNSYSLRASSNAEMVMAAGSVIKDPSIGPMVDDTFGDTAIATIALYSDGFSMAELRETAREIRERLNLMEGIQKIDLTGVQEERIYMEFSNTKLTQLSYYLT